MFKPTYTLTPRFLRQIIQIERGCGFLEAIQLDPSRAAALQKMFRVDDALSSVQIEGSSLTRIRAAQLADDALEVANESEQEFLNYYSAFNAIDDLRGQRDYAFSARDLLNLHGILVQGVRGEHHAGRFRDGSVEVGDQQGAQRVVHHLPPEAEEVRGLVDELMDWVEGAKDKGTKKRRPDVWEQPVAVAAIAQHRFVWIHPFFDGNGRTARMFTTALLFQRRYDFKYLFDLSSYYNRDRDKYYAALRTADATGDYTAWIEYFAGGLALQIRAAVERGRGVAMGVVADDANREGDDDVA